MATEQEELILALQESQDALQEEVTRLRRSNSILRTVVRTLRETQRRQARIIELAQQNDDLFKRFCNGEFDALVGIPGEGGLPVAEQPVEPAVANAEEASAPTSSC